MCLILDGDLFEHIGEGRAEVVTDHVDHVDATGIVLKSGARIDADVIVTATGLQLQALGGIAISVDGDEIKPTDRFVYKEYLLEDVPNMAWCIGYTNASWTLRADMTARAVAKLLAYMDSHGYTHAYPHLGDEPMKEKPTFDLESGYVTAGAARAAEVGHPPAVERPAQLRARRSSTTASTASRSRWCSAASARTTAVEFGPLNRVAARSARDRWAASR